MIRCIKKSNYLIGNRTLDLLAYRILPQLTTLSLAPFTIHRHKIKTSIGSTHNMNVVLVPGIHLCCLLIVGKTLV
jgi:hypothetical protein